VTSARRLALPIALRLAACLAASGCAPPPLAPTPPAAAPAALRLLSHNHWPAEVLVFARPGNRDFVAALAHATEAASRAGEARGRPPVAFGVVRWRHGGNAWRAAGAPPPRFVIDADTPRDVWLQDVAELAVARPAAGGPARRLVIDPNRDTPLHRAVPWLAHRWSAAWVRLPPPGEHDANGAGNVEVLPGDVLLLGSTAGAPWASFLLERGYRGRHVRVDTSWLEIGHVDEVFSHLVTGEPPCRFALVRASPGAALELLAGAADRPRALRDLADASGGAARTQRVLEARLAAAAEAVRAAVAAALPACPRVAVIPLPVLFACEGAPGSPGSCRARLPNPVNMAVLGRHALVADPGWPPFRHAVEARLRAAGQTPHVLDDAFYHQRAGGVHCATTVLRHADRYVDDALGSSDRARP